MARLHRVRIPRPGSTVAAFAFLLLLTACSGGDDAGEGGGAVTDDQATAASGAADTTTTASTAPEVDQAAEVADQVTRLAEQSGIDPTQSDLTLEDLACLEESGVDLFALGAGVVPDDAQAVFQAFLDCLPDIADNDQIVGGYVGGLELAAGNGLEIELDQGRCMVRSIVDRAEVPARALTTPTAEDSLVLVEAAQECLTEDQFARFSGRAGFQAYGDDPRLDGVFDLCAGGDDRACDLLFVLSADGTEYRDLAFECAGRRPASETSCSADGEIDPTTGFLDPSGPGAGVLVADCEAGDFLACDLLLQLSSIGGELEGVASTCGGRLDFVAVPDCRSVLGD